MYRLKYDRKEKSESYEQVCGHQQWMKDHRDQFRCVCQGRCKVEIYSSLRSRATGIFICSRYFATVRRAIL
jgi:hypothetical protein